MEREPTRRLLIGTSNPSKLLRWSAVLDGYRVVGPAELGLVAEVEEASTAVIENATKKALTYARLSGMVSLSEDAGLRVEALGNFPGAQLRTWGGLYPRRLEDSELADLLAHALSGASDTRSSFDVAVAVASPDGFSISTATESRGYFDLTRLDAGLEAGNPLSSAFISFDTGLPWTEMVQFDARPARSQDFVVHVREMISEVFAHWSE